jgi:hypothetical protein
MQKPAKNITIKLEIESHKLITEIVKRTGETKVDLFKRIIASDHKRILNGESLNESVNKRIEDISATLNEILPHVRKTSEDTSAVREGAGRIYCAVLFSLKELLRMIHLMCGCFMNMTTLTKDQLSTINDSAHQDATNTYGNAFKLLSDLPPREIFEMLRKK